MSAAGAEGRSFTCLVNPHSGAGASLEYVVDLARVLREHGASVEVSYTASPQAVRPLAEAAHERGDVVVAVGGDGMVASIVGPMSDLASSGDADRVPVLGIAPAGRGNDFARMLEVPEGAEALARRLLESDARDVDVLDVRSGGSSWVVAGSVYAGADAHAAAMVARMRRTPKALQYPIAAIRAIATYVPHRYRLVVDGEEREVAAATVIVANSAYYGAGMKVAPAAVVDDGLLDVVVVGAGSRVELATAFPKIYDGSHVDHPKVTVLRGREVELSALDERPVPLGADGEDLGLLPRPGDPLRISVRHRALRVL